MAAPSAGPWRLVVDTNAALDLLLFRDPRADAVRDALASGRAQWWSTPSMRDELQRVVQRPALARYDPDCERILLEHDRWTMTVADAAFATTALLRCRDVDDQVYLDLALHLRPATIVTSDRDLLVLARRATRLGVAISRPADACGSPPAGDRCAASAAGPRS